MEAVGENIDAVALVPKKIRKNLEAITDGEGEDFTNGPINQKILPEEVLEMVFLSLSDPDDLFDVSNSCPQFQRILGPAKPVWAFDMVFPLIYSNLDKKDILHCRAVCKGWNETVDKFLQTHPIIRSLEPYPNQPNPRRTYAADCNKQGPQFVPTLIQKGFFGDSFVTSRAINAFLEKAKFHSRNPFIMRYVELANCTSQEAVPAFYWFNAENLLQRFGQHIWHIHLSPRSLFIGIDTVTDCYIVLQKALVQVPNLKKLSVSGFKGYNLYISDDPVHLKALVNYIRYHPLPALPYLEVMECAIPVHAKTVPVHDELMTRYGSQLNKIFVWLRGWPEDKIQYRNMPNLRELQICVNDTDLVCVNMIKSLNAPQLKKIYMIFRLDVDIITILKVLKDSCPSLTYLGLWFRKKPLETLCLPQFLLEGVKTLELVESQQFPYELLLSYFPNLEHVLILADPSQAENQFKIRPVDENKDDLEVGEQNLRQSEVKGFSSSKGIYTCGIWDHLKTLKEFTIATLGQGFQDEQIVAKVKFTREIYECLKKQ